MLTETEEETVKPVPPIDCRAIAMDETEYYSFERGDKQYIKKMLGVYIYDKNSNTYCCEMTPSYWLIHVYDTCVLNSRGQELSESEKDRIYQKYEHCQNDQPGRYFHCNYIDSFEGKKGRYVVYGNPEVSEDDVSRDDQMEAIREYYQGNCPF